MESKQEEQTTITPVSSQPNEQKPPQTEEIVKELGIDNEIKKRAKLD